MGEIVPLLTEAKCIQLVQRCDTLVALNLLQVYFEVKKVDMSIDMMFAVLEHESRLELKGG